MIRKIKNIVGLYLCNPTFVALAGFFFLALFVSKLTYVFYIFDLSEDFFTLLFVISVWLAFEMGSLIKRQYANFRSALFPGYRAPHAWIATFLLFFFLVSVALWRKGINVLFIVNLQEYTGVTSFCLLIYLLIIYVAYLSVGRLVFLSYFILLLGAGQSQSIIAFLGRSPLVSQVLLGMAIITGIYFWQRLMTLSEDSFEYPFLLSWSQRDFMLGQGPEPRLLGWVRAKLSFNQAGLAPYPQAGAVLRRATHWDSLEKPDLLAILILLFVFLPLHILYVKNFTTMNSIYLRPFANLLVFAIAPVLVALCLNYRKSTLLSYDFLKPLRREDLLRDRAVLLVLYFGGAWILFSLFFAIIPNMVLKTVFLTMPVFWLYLLFCGIFGYLILAWIIYMATLSAAWKVILQGIFSAIVVQIEFMLMPYVTVNLLGWNILLAVVAAVFLTRLAWRRWGKVEF